MQMLEQLKRSIGYVAEAMLELFSPNHDSYPSTGIQPFDGDPHKARANRND